VVSVLFNDLFQALNASIRLMQISFKRFMMIADQSLCYLCLSLILGHSIHGCIFDFKIHLSIYLFIPIASS